MRWLRDMWDDLFAIPEPPRWDMPVYSTISRALLDQQAELLDLQIREHLEQIDNEALMFDLIGQPGAWA